MRKIAFLISLREYKRVKETLLVKHLRHGVILFLVIFWYSILNLQFKFALWPFLDPLQVYKIILYKINIFEKLRYISNKN